MNVKIENRFTLTVFFANLSKAVPCDLKILTFAFSNSLRSMPSLRGIEPINKATSTSLKAVSSLSVGITPEENIQSNFLFYLFIEDRTFH